MNQHKYDIMTNIRMRKSYFAIILATQSFIALTPAWGADVQAASAVAASPAICVPQTCGSDTIKEKPVVFKKIVHKKKIAKPKKVEETPVVEKAEKVENYDALALDPSISLKNIPFKEIELPGVLHVDGESMEAFDPSKSHKISWANQGIQPILLSLTGPDLIVTPFNDPFIVGNSYLSINKRANSNNVYVSFNFPEGVTPVPVSIFIEDPAGGQALGLQLIPKKIPQQVYIVVDETDHLASKQLAKGADFPSHVQELMEIAAFGGTPSGYSAAPFNLPPIVLGSLKLEAVRRLSNSEGDLYVYGVTNPSNTPFMLNEKQFDGPRVKAVSIFPKPELLKNERATVIVFAQKLGGK